MPGLKEESKSEEWWKDTIHYFFATPTYSSAGQTGIIFCITQLLATTSAQGGNHKSSEENVYDPMDG